MSAQQPKAQPPIPPILLTMERAAAALDLPYTTFQEKVKRGEFAYVVVGGGRHRQHRRFLVDDLIAWADRNRVAAVWEQPSQAE